jgi:hypothetical protein
LTVENVDIDVMRVAVEIAAQDINQVVDAVFLRFAECLGNDGEGVGNTVTARIVRKLLSIRFLQLSLWKYGNKCRKSLHQTKL